MSKITFRPPRSVTALSGLNLSGRWRMLTASGMAAALVMGGVVVVPNLLDNEPAAQAETAAPGSSEETAINTTVPAGSTRSVNGFVGLQTGGTMQSNLNDPNVAPMSGVKAFCPVV